jgi:predicted CXXCH cytochrome family protein
MCATCHNPHIGESSVSKLRGVVSGGAAICVSCHRFD